MKNLIVVAVLIILVSLSCRENDLCLTGSGPIYEYELDMPDFKHVSLLGPINLRIKQGPEINVVVKAESDIFSHMSYEVKNEKLEIGFKDNIRCFETDYGVWVNITVPNLESINSSGISEIIYDGSLDFAKLEIDISGKASIELLGEINEQTIRSSGTINVENFQLETESTTINVSGSGDIEVSCIDELNIDVSGSATIAYTGNPSITQKSSGSLTLINAN